MILLARLNEGSDDMEAQRSLKVGLSASIIRITCTKQYYLYIIRFNSIIISILHNAMFVLSARDCITYTSYKT